MEEKMFVVFIERFTMPETRTVYGPFTEDMRSKIEATLRQSNFTGNSKWWCKPGGIRATIYELKSLDKTGSVW